MANTALDGAHALMEGLRQHQVEYIFGYPGGANIPIFDALLDSPIKLILVRHEQGATHMADGYARATGKAGVVLVTSGPGATNTITGIMTAHMDSVPLVVICGQTITSNLGLDAFQEADVLGISYPVVKHSYLVKDTNDIPRIIKEAFFLAETGRPGPVLIDIPKDVATGVCHFDASVEMQLPGYTIPDRGDSVKISTVAEWLRQAERPLLLVGHGAVIANASKAIHTLVEKMKIPVTNTLLGKGGFPESHPLSLGMLGMHGTAYANTAVMNCDLIMSIGSRWDDRIVGDPNTFCQEAKKIHIDIDPAEFHKMIHPDCCITGDARLVIEEINSKAEPGDTSKWLESIKKWKEQYPLKYSKRKGLKAQHVLDEFYQLTKGKVIISADVGQHQMWAAQFCKVDSPRFWLTSGGSGTMGYAFPAAIGAQLAHRDALVVAIVGDGGFQMTMAELSTLAINKLPVKILIINNRYLGMVRQWQSLFFHDRYSGVDLEGNPDFVKLAEAYGVKGYRIRRKCDIKRVLQEALYEYPGPVVIDAEVDKEDNVFPMVPAGHSYEEMVLERPKKALEKPVGST